MIHNTYMKRLILISLLISACQTVDHRKEFEAQLHSHVGESISSTIFRKGVPTRTVDLPDGTKVYEWEYKDNDRISKYDAFSNRMITTDDSSICLVDYIANKEGIIIKWAWRGDYCR